MSPVAREPQLFGVENLLREVGYFLADCEQRQGRNDDFELGDENALPPRTIPDADVPAARIFLQNICDVVQRYLAQHFRWERMDSHFRNSPEHSPTASDSESCALSVSRHNKNFRAPQLYVDECGLRSVSGKNWNFRSSRLGA